DVAAGAESFAGARDHDHAHVGIVGRVRQCVREILTQRAAERVEALRPIQRQRGDVILGLVDEAFVAHGGRVPFRRDALLCLNFAKETRWPPTFWFTAHIREAGSGDRSPHGCARRDIWSSPPRSTAAASALTQSAPASRSGPTPVRSRSCCFLRI